MYNDSNLNFFTEKVTGYDKNGNIKGLQRYGQTSGGGYGLIDNLTYTLDGNRLNRVDDAAGTAAYNSGFEFVDGASQADEYTYDTNGNLTKDLNKNIIDIQYNVLNLPSKVTFGDGSTITYTYAADGTKLRTVHAIGGITTTTDYCGNVVYENGVQKLLLTETGYVTLNDNRYHYYLQDHQGNNRVVMSQDGSVEETNHYYPFGGVFASSGNVQPYKYNGKELDTKKGLDLYDYGARQYDAALGRFTTVDAMAEKHYSIGTYAYCGNEPVSRIDPDGNDWRVQTWYNRETDKIEYIFTVNAALQNSSSNLALDMQALATVITAQINAAYTISQSSFISTMNFNLRVVDKIEDVKDNEHLFQVIDQKRLGKGKDPQKRTRGQTQLFGLDIQIGTVAANEMLSGKDNRTAAHELGHTGGLEHKKKKVDVNNLMMQKTRVQYFNGNYMQATDLSLTQIRAIRDNYIHKRLHKPSVLRNNINKKR